MLFMTDKYIEFNMHFGLEALFSGWFMDDYDGYTVHYIIAI